MTSNQMNSPLLNSKSFRVGRHVYPRTIVSVSKYKADFIIILLKISLFSPWYGWKIAEMALNNNNQQSI